MKFHRYIVLIFLVCIISISAVSAASDIIANGNQEPNLEESINEDVSIDESNEEPILEESDETILESEDEETPKSFAQLDNDINGNEASEITLSGNYKYTEDDSDYKMGIRISRSVTINGNGSTIDGSNMARIFYLEGNWWEEEETNVIIKNINFINGNVTEDDWGARFGSAIYSDGGVMISIINSTFNNNTSEYGGAIYSYSEPISIINSSFNNNTAEYGGAIHSLKSSLSIINSTFNNNIAGYNGGAIYWDTLTDSRIANSTFNNNTAESGGALYIYYRIIGGGGEEWEGMPMQTASDKKAKAYASDSEEEDVFTITNSIFTNNIANQGGAIMEYKGNAEEESEGEGMYGSPSPTIKSIQPDDIYKEEGVTLSINNNVFLNNKNTLYFENVEGYNVDYNWFGNDVGNYSLKPNDYCDNWLFLNASANPDTIPALNASEILFKLYLFNSESGVTDYDNSILSSIKFDVSSTNGKTDKNEASFGEIITYTATGGKTGSVSATIVDITQTVKLKITQSDTVPAVDPQKPAKTSPKISAKAKSFKFDDKTKKYTVILKNNKGKAIKNAKVTLKVNGKTYTATTNSKGIATFELKKLSKAGKYNAVITYSGDDNYKKVSKKAKITVNASKKAKSTFKTISKGSKDKKTVEKIQRALKKNGYYISYKGRRLIVDGIYGPYTERAVKEFQRDKGLKVTGKVDEKTAKKLKII